MSAAPARAVASSVAPLSTIPPAPMRERLASKAARRMRHATTLISGVLPRAPLFPYPGPATAGSASRSPINSPSVRRSAGSCPAFASDSMYGTNAG